ncbi:DKNYY domain-containing protein [Aureibaculum sp. A20]|uniref:DKNYY domain-containing protein n=1 Tax=Aureibaculum flavum TaxID=2795986 RepID=A0ABS0WV55_9FLAO|nr:DKNYY domain-containing protein [Aureibaculum flavum]MBJ2175850.1 DKNYY domain-containing protein [Aureibaculum flavum]
MNKYICILTLTFSFTIAVIGQVKEPKGGHSGCTYLEEPNYIVNKETVYFENCSIHRKVDVNPNELKIIVDGLALDNSNMFYNGLKLNIIPSNPKVVQINSYRDKSIYWINDDYFYRNDIKIDKIDTLTFTSIGDDYFKDKNSVYYRNKLINDADPTTFVYNYPFGYDKNSVYEGDKKVKTIQNLQSVNGHYFKDSTTVFEYNNKKLFNLKPRYDITVQNTKSIPKTKYGIVNDTLYYLNEPTIYTHIDTKNITVFAADLIGFDDKIIFRGSTTTALDANSLQVIKNNAYDSVVKDKNGTYQVNIEYRTNKILLESVSIKKEKTEPYTTVFPVQMVTDALYKSNYPLATKKLLTQGGITDFDSIELVSILKGYRMGCSQDTQSPSNYYILKNNQGYWELIKSRKDILTFVGKTYKF